MARQRKMSFEVTWNTRRDVVLWSRPTSDVRLRWLWASGRRGYHIADQRHRSTTLRPGLEHWKDFDAELSERTVDNERRSKAW